MASVVHSTQSSLDYINLSYSLIMFGDCFKVVLTKGIGNVSSGGDQ